MGLYEDICVISTYLPIDGAQAVLWNKLNAELRANGVFLVLLTTTSSERLEACYLQIPYLLTGFAAEAGAVTPSVCYPASYLESDAAWSRRSAPAPGSTAGLARCVDFYRTLLDTLEPCVTFAWNTTVPQSRVLHAESIKRGIPAFALERGFFPNTLMVESRENSALSDLNLNPALLSAQADFVASAERLAAIRAYYQAHRVAKYPCRQAVTPEQYRHQHRIGKDERLVVLFGSAAAANWLPRSHHSATYNSPHFGSLAEAARALLEVLPDDCRLIVQPHPIDGTPPGLAAERVIVNEGESIHTLLEVADAYAFLGCTTIQQEALLYQRPVILLSRSQLSGKGVAYEYEGYDLRGVVAQALRRVAWTPRCHAAARYLDFVFQHFLYGHDGAPTAHDLGDFARFVARTASGHPSPPLARVEQLVAQVEAMG